MSTIGQSSKILKLHPIAAKHPTVRLSDKAHIQSYRLTSEINCGEAWTRALDSGLGFIEKASPGIKINSITPKSRDGLVSQADGVSFWAKG